MSQFLVRRIVSGLICTISVIRPANSTGHDQAGNQPLDAMGEFLSALNSDWAANVVGAILVGLIVFVIQEYLKRRAILNVFNPVRIKKGHRKNSVMVIGLGGSGKTSLINALGDVLKLGKEIETDLYKISSFTLHQDRTTYDFYMSDYRGQDFGTQVSAFIQQQLMPSTSMRYGDINSLVLIVDLLPPDSKQKNNFDVSRVEQHLQEWNRTALDAVFGMLERESLNFVCLFINKYNLMSSQGKPAETAIKKSYSELIRDLQRRCRYKDETTGQMVPYARFRTIIGGTVSGAGLPDLQQNLMELSKPTTQPI